MHQGMEEMKAEMEFLMVSWRNHGRCSGHGRPNAQIVDKPSLFALEITAFLSIWLSI